MKNILSLVLIAATIFSCTEDKNVITDHHQQFSDAEKAFLQELHIDVAQAKVINGYVVSDQDYVISRNDMKEHLQKLNSRHATRDVTTLPDITDTDEISLLVDPSFSSLPLWNTALDQAISCINGLEDSRVFLTRNGTVDDYDIFIVKDDAQDPLVPSHPDMVDACMNSSTFIALAHYPVLEDIGEFIVLCSNHLSITPKDKVMIHEIYHTLGMLHACNLAIPPTYIETTFVADMYTECDETSVMLPTLNSFPGSSIPDTYCDPTGSTNPNVVVEYNNNPGHGGHSLVDGCQWVNPDDVFSMQALYPITYEPLQFEIISCKEVYTVTTVPHNQRNGLFEYCFNFIENDFTPYELKFEMVNTATNQVLGSSSTYRCWPDCMEIEVQTQNWDKYDDCIEIRLTALNFKEDYTNTVVSNNCCIIPK